MGELADKAKEMSKWLLLDMNESVIVKYMGYKFVPSKYDPDKEAVDYTLDQDGNRKHWTNGSTYVMNAFDVISIGSMVRITRKPMTDKDDNIIAGKSVYDIEAIK